MGHRLLLPLPFPTTTRRPLSDEDWNRLTRAVERRALKVARLNERLDLAKASLKEALDAVHEATNED